MDKDPEVTTVWVERAAANELRISVIKKYGGLKPHFTKEISRALRDRARKLGGR